MFWDHDVIMLRKQHSKKLHLFGSYQNIAAQPICIKEEIIIQIIEYLKLNKNENITYLYVWDSSKVLFIGKCIALYAFMEETSVLF